MLRLTKRYRFSASHRLHTGELSREENARLFGKCNNPFGHGHDYYLEVGVCGKVDPRSGLLVERRALDRLVERTVLGRLDHANLNDQPEFRDAVPTTENLAMLIRRWLAESWEAEFGDKPAYLARVRIEETPRNSFEVTA